VPTFLRNAAPYATSLPADDTLIPKILIATLVLSLTGPFDYQSVTACIIIDCILQLQSRFIKKRSLYDSRMSYKFLEVTMP